MLIDGLSIGNQNLISDRFYVSKYNTNLPTDILLVNSRAKTLLTHATLSDGFTDDNITDEHSVNNSCDFQYSELSRELMVVGKISSKNCAFLVVLLHFSVGVSLGFQTV